MTIEGEYTAKRNGEVYRYEASCHLDGDRLHWSAKVRRGNRVCGTPNGIVLNGAKVIHEDFVRALVETSIEHRAGVD